MASYIGMVFLFILNNFPVFGLFLVPLPLAVFPVLSYQKYAL